MNLAEQAEKTLIAADMRLCLDVNINPRFRRIQGVAALALMPFFSAFFLDSYHYMSKKSPELAKVLQPNLELLKNSRLRLKPLEIHGKRFEDILKDTNQLARINSGWFRDTRPRILRFISKFIQKDLGIFLMDGEIISTTHLAFMNLGLTEERLNQHSLALRNLGPFLQKIFEGYGLYSSNLYVVLANEVSDGNEIQAEYMYQLLALTDSFNLILSGEHMDDSRVNRTLSVPYRDVHSEPFYEQIAKTRGPEQTAAFILLLAALSQINSARVLIPKVSDDNDLAALKVRFLSLYHATHTINKLSAQSRRSNLIYPQALDLIGEALGNRSVRRIRKMKSLRDNLIHYGVKPHIVPRLSENLPLSGLIEAHTNGGSLVDLWNEVTVGLDHIVEVLGPLLPNDLASRARVD